MLPADMADFYQIPPHKANYPPFQSQRYIKKNKKKVAILSIVSILCSQSIDSSDTKFFQYLPSLIHKSSLMTEIFHLCLQEDLYAVFETVSPLNIFLPDYGLFLKPQIIIERFVNCLKRSS